MVCVRERERVEANLPQYRIHSFRRMVPLENLESFIWRKQCFPVQFFLQVNPMNLNGSDPGEKPTETALCAFLQQVCLIGWIW